MRLFIICEGYTEEDVLKDFLAPYCKQFESVVVRNAKGAGRLKDEYISVAETVLETPDTHVLYLIDLKNEPFGFSLDPRVQQDLNPPQILYRLVHETIGGSVNPSLQDRFHPFPVVWEIETWLLADVEILNNDLKPRGSQRISQYPNPESVIDPASELKQLFRQNGKRDYNKTVDGKRLFSSLDAQSVYADNCPYFEIVIDELLAIQGLQPARPQQTSDVVQELQLQLRQLQAELAEIEILEWTTDVMNRIEAIEDEINALYAKILDEYL